MASEPKPAWEAEQIRIQLSTSDPQLQLLDKLDSFLVSTSLRRVQLSQLVNKLLESETPIPLEFRIKEEFLPASYSLSDFLTKKGISAETTLQVEYLRAIRPPTEASTFAHDDWVGGVDVLSNTSPACLDTSSYIQSGHERILAGSFDGILKVWDMSGHVVASSKPQPNDKRLQCIVSAKFITPSLAVSGGHDCRLRVWNFQEDPNGLPTSNERGSLTVSHELYGHKHFLRSIEVHAPSRQILSASYDETVMLWSTDSPSDNSSVPPAPENFLRSARRSDAASQDGENKRRKRNALPFATAGPLLTLRGHDRPVAAAIFKPADPTVAYTASDDRTVRTWDLVTGAQVSSRTPLEQVALSSMCAVPSLSLLAVGNHMRTVVLVDPRASATAAVVMTLKGHRNQVSAVVTQPASSGSGNSNANGNSSSYGLLSGSHDGTCRIWDLRNASLSVNSMATVSSVAGGGGGAAGKVGRESFRIPRQSNPASRNKDVDGAKVFDVKWDEVVGIVSASEDKRVQVDGFGDLGGAGINGGDDSIGA